MNGRQHGEIIYALLVVLMITAGCSKIPIPPDQGYRTPIPESTLLAYSFGAPIADRLQAVIAARAFLNSTRLESLQPPEVLLAERMTLAEAIQRTAAAGEQSYQDLPPDTPVWLVIFNGVWRIHPPDPGHTFTPLAPIRACQYVWMPENGSGYGGTGGMGCPDEK